jgi:sterol desaturase/sphingolipid hydroxylase (fatty acid hydroxylase superfamily)
MTPKISHLTVYIAAFFLLLFVAEMLWPLRKATQSRLSRIFVNFCLSIPMILAASLLIRPVGLHMIAWTMQVGFGLLHWLPMPVALQFIVGFLLLDLSFYYWHRLNHTVPLLWRFHNVHHVDPDLDVTTSLRFHFGEVVNSAIFRLLQLGILGVSPVTFIVYEIAFQANTLFQHSNVRLPICLERCLNKCLVTPRMHGIHHSQVKVELNSNYSVVFPWWDWIHKTLRLNVPQQAVTIGVPGYHTPDTNRPLHLLALPFEKQHDYWHLPNGEYPKRQASQETTQAQINYLLE